LRLFSAGTNVSGWSSSTSSDGLLPPQGHLTVPTSPSTDTAAGCETCTTRSNVTASSSPRCLDLFRPQADPSLAHDLTRRRSLAQLRGHERRGPGDITVAHARLQVVVIRRPCSKVLR
jgi:hypothetical protein